MRTPDATDVEDIARVHVEGWRETYAGQLPDSSFDADALARRRQMWTSILTSPPRSTRRVAVATSNGHIVGLALADEPRDAADRAAGVTQQLYALYLLSAHHGSGLGQRMLDAVIDDGPALLWVAKDNPRAQSFYRRNGFTLDGTEIIDDDVPTFVECRMVRS
ncbi:GNAT family N-acetyltransferase [Microcella putealis]|uniref:GNAT family N-acetyltransferase n=1 Tax=Microcella putealis TaxID=337005 RepID=UPI001F546143|nr:GNAT family N-acetyltransferase [Microcella putealis]